MRAGFWVKKIMRKSSSLRDNSSKIYEQQTEGENPNISSDLCSNLSYIEQIMGKSEDLITRVLYLGGSGKKAAVVYIDGLGDDYFIADMIVGILIEGVKEGNKTDAGDSLDSIERRLLPAGEIKKVRSLGKVIKGVLTGTSAVLVDGCCSALLIGTPSQKIGRGIEKPDTENVVRGSRESFTENLKTNTVLLRRIIKSPYIRFRTHDVGQYTDTKVLVSYIEGIVDEGLLEEVTSRIERIKIDGILESGYIEQLIEDAPKSIFPTVGNTERPDRVAASLLEGKVAIFTDGTPVVLIVPWLFWNVLQTPEDYYSRPYASSILRLVRLGSIIITMFLPAAYVSLASFHPEMLPTVLAITIASSREGIPFPTLVEMLLMGLVFESLREAGVRLPRAVGQAVSIVGALVIGDIAVSAGFFSAPGVVITAFAGISSFAVPALTDAYIPIRLISVVLSGFLGFYGLGLFVFILLVHMCSLRSLGVPYLTPVAPLVLGSWKDIIIRAPLWLLDRRPPGLNQSDRRRMPPGMRPKPPVEDRGKKR